MKRVTSAALVTLLLLSTIFVSASADVGSPSSWAKAEVQSLVQKNIIPEKIQSNYQNSITRAEFTAVVVRMCEYAVGTFPSSKNVFIDIGDSPYKKEILNAKELGIVDGTSSASFSPDATLTREQAAKILSATVERMRGVSAPGAYALSFRDKGAISSWAAKYVAFCVSYGLMNGTGNNEFSPKKTLTREEAYAMVDRMIKKHAWANIKEITALWDSSAYQNLSSQINDEFYFTDYPLVSDDYPQYNQCRAIDFRGDGSLELIGIYEGAVYDPSYNEYYPAVKFGFWEYDGQKLNEIEIQELGYDVSDGYISISKVKYQNQYYLDIYTKSCDGPYIEASHELYKYQNGSLDLSHVLSYYMEENYSYVCEADGKSVSHAYFKQIETALQPVKLLEFPS